MENIDRERLRHFQEFTDAWDVDGKIFLKRGIHSLHRTTISTQSRRGISAGVWLCLQTIDRKADR
jgi:hypothetical protein